MTTLWIVSRYYVIWYTISLIRSLTIFTYILYEMQARSAYQNLMSTYLEAYPQTAFMSLAPGLRIDLLYTARHYSRLQKYWKGYKHLRFGSFVRRRMGQDIPLVLIISSIDFSFSHSRFYFLGIMSYTWLFRKYHFYFNNFVKNLSNSYLMMMFEFQFTKSYL